jgi:hypothetical protein
MDNIQRSCAACQLRGVNIGNDPQNWFVQIISCGLIGKRNQPDWTVVMALSNLTELEYGGKLGCLDF